MKKTMSLLLAALMLLSMVGCGVEEPQATTLTSETTVLETGETTVPETTAEPTTVPTTVPETTAEETEPAETVHEHSYTKEKVEPTCTEKGYTVYTCECGDSYCGDEVKAKGHDYKTKKVEPTETKQGYTKHTCSVCGHTYKDNYVDATGKEETKPAETQPQETTPPATEPAETNPQETTPPTTEPAETTKPAETEPEETTQSAGDEFGGITPETLTYEIWRSWNRETQKKFRQKYPYQEITDKQLKYEYYQIMYYEGYICPGPCRCITTAAHERKSTSVCWHCGKTGFECPSNNVETGDIYTSQDQISCPEYNIKNDPTMYCQDCGWPKDHEIEPDDYKRCHKYLQDMNCTFCGVWVEAYTCHHCVHTSETEYCQDCGRPRSSDIEPDPFKRCHYWHSDRYCKYCGEPAAALKCHHCTVPAE